MEKETTGNELCPFVNKYCLCQYCDVCNETDKMCGACKFADKILWTKVSCHRFTGINPSTGEFITGKRSIWDADTEDDC